MVVLPAEPERLLPGFVFPEPVARDGIRKPAAVLSGTADFQERPIDLLNVDAARARKVNGRMRPSAMSALHPSTDSLKRDAACSRKVPIANFQ